MVELALFMTVMNSLKIGIKSTWASTNTQLSLLRQDLMSLINLYQPTMVMVLQRILLVQFFPWTQSHQRSIWKRCSSKTCIALDLRHHLSAQSQMMKLENSLFLSTVVMTPFRFTKSVIRTPEELVEDSWRERSRPTQLLVDITKRRTSFLDQLYSWLDSNSCLQRLMSTLRNTWKTTPVFSQRPH